MRWEDDSIEDPYYPTEGMQDMWNAYINAARDQLVKKLRPCPRCGKMCSWGYCSESCMMGRPGLTTLYPSKEHLDRLKALVTGPAATSVKVPMEEMKLESRIWACIDCGFIWKNVRLHTPQRPECPKCETFFSTIGITWYEVTLAARNKQPGAEKVLRELAHERT